MQGMKSEAWGKTDRESGGIHPLAHHSMDVAAVFARMVEAARPISGGLSVTAADLGHFGPRKVHIVARQGSS